MLNEHVTTGPDAPLTDDDDWSWSKEVHDKLKAVCPSVRIVQFDGNGLCDKDWQAKPEWKPGDPECCAGFSLKSAGLIMIAGTKAKCDEAVDLLGMEPLYRMDWGYMDPEWIHKAQTYLLYKAPDGYGDPSRLIDPHPALKNGPFCFAVESPGNPEEEVDAVAEAVRLAQMPGTAAPDVKRLGTNFSTSWTEEVYNEFKAACPSIHVVPFDVEGMHDDDWKEKPGWKPGDPDPWAFGFSLESAGLVLIGGGKATCDRAVDLLGMDPLCRVTLSLASSTYWGPLAKEAKEYLLYKAPDRDTANRLWKHTRIWSGSRPEVPDSHTSLPLKSYDWDTWECKRNKKQTSPKIPIKVNRYIDGDLPEYWREGSFGVGSGMAPKDYSPFCFDHDPDYHEEKEAVLEAVRLAQLPETKAPDYFRLYTNIYPSAEGRERWEKDREQWEAKGRRNLTVDERLQLKADVKQWKAETRWIREIEEREQWEAEERRIREARKDQLAFLEALRKREEAQQIQADMVGDLHRLSSALGIPRTLEFKEDTPECEEGLCTSLVNRNEGLMGRVRHIPETDEWMGFFKIGWRRVEQHEMLDALTACATANMGVWRKEKADPSQPPKLVWSPAPAKFGKVSVGQGIAKNLSGKVSTPLPEWDADTYVMMLPDGRSVDLRPRANMAESVNLKTEDPSIRSLQRFRLPAVPATREEVEKSNFKKVLNHVVPDPEVQRWLQCILGAAFVQNTKDYDMDHLIVLVGPKRSGKSTFQKAIEHAFGAFAGTVDPANLVRGGFKPHHAWIAKLNGCRLIVAGELAKGRNLDEEVVNNLLGGAPISAALKHKDEVTFTLSAPILCTSNATPTQRGVNTSRLRIVKCGPTIPDADRLGYIRGSMDSPQEAAAVLRWIFDGITDEKVPVPQSMLAAMEEIAEGSDINEFLAEHPTIVSNKAYLLKDLFTAWKSFHHGRGTNPTSKSTFKALMEEVGFEHLEIRKYVHMIRREGGPVPPKAPADGPGTSQDDPPKAPADGPQEASSCGYSDADGKRRQETYYSHGPKRGEPNKNAPCDHVF